MGCFYTVTSIMRAARRHVQGRRHEGRHAVSVQDQAHKGRCALALKSHKKELCECDEQERNDYCADLAAASGAIKAVGLHQDQPLGSFGDSNPHLHFHIVPKYEGGFEFGGSFAITNPEPVFLKDEEYQENDFCAPKELGHSKGDAVPFRYAPPVPRETGGDNLSSARRTRAAAARAEE